MQLDWSKTKHFAGMKIAFFAHFCLYLDPHFAAKCRNMKLAFMANMAFTANGASWTLCSTNDTQ